MSYLHYDDVALLLLCYLALVVGVDLVSAGLRRLAR
jgi:ABC-type phosphate/phosphonate transport system permease subunit